jgi:hypothetical protein
VDLSGLRLDCRGFVFPEGFAYLSGRAIPPADFHYARFGRGESLSTVKWVLIAVAPERISPAGPNPSRTSRKQPGTSLLRTK